MAVGRVLESVVTCRCVHQQIPRDRNQLANYFSRIVDDDDWHIDPQCLQC